MNRNNTTPTPLMFRTIVAVFLGAFAVVPAHAEATPSRADQLAALQQRSILVPMWGWPPDEMAQAARAFGYEVVNAPHGNDLDVHREEAEIWAEAGLDMIVRPAIPVEDPWDPDDVARGIEDVAKVIAFHDANPHVVGYVIAWGLYGEGGFPWEYAFSDRALRGFNDHMGTPGGTFPDPPEANQPGSLRYVKWLEYRQRVLRDFRARYIRELKEKTDKLVGTWSEFYPTEVYQLNMGDAPGADFLFYDLSFGDVTVDQTIAFAETHGDMQHHETFESYRDHILPKMAKAAGEGVVPVAFQFPMRRGHAVDFLSKTTVFTDSIEEEYSLRIQPEIERLINTLEGRTREPEVALAYPSFAAAALPGGDAYGLYQNGTRQLEGLLRQMGVDLRIIPWEWLATHDLAQYELVVVPQPMYLSEAMREHLETARRVLYAGEYGLTHHDPATAEGDFATGWSAEWPGGGMRYHRAPAAQVSVAAVGNALVEGVNFGDTTYPADQTAAFAPLPDDAEVLLRAGDAPMAVALEGGRRIHILNRWAEQAWAADDAALEQPLYRFLHNLLEEAGATVRVESEPQARVREGFPFGSYGVVGYAAYNELDRPIELRLADDGALTIPPNGWALVETE